MEGEGASEEFAYYIEKKIMSRLATLARYKKVSFSFKLFKLLIRNPAILRKAHCYLGKAIIRRPVQIS